MRLLKSSGTRASPTARAGPQIPFLVFEVELLAVLGVVWGVEDEEEREEVEVDELEELEDELVVVAAFTGFRLRRTLAPPICQ